MVAGRQDARSVPCGACHACCKISWVFLDPEAGDVVALYDTVDVIHPATGAPVKALAHKPNGGPCVYLGPNGCAIHDHAPALCRRFDCRLYYLDMMAKPRAVRKRDLREQYSAQKLFDAGRALQRKAPVDVTESTATL